ncbi:MAG: PSD1 domain-containing protein [Planctomycetales bacterium]|nr:PSD1 domain-containing protein [Planctomycetales bacterium]
MPASSLRNRPQGPALSRRLVSCVPWRWGLLLATIVILGNAAGSALAQETESGVDYQREVRPLLSDRCLACHGPDANTREADLRLDVNQDWAERGAIVPESLDESDVWFRITTNDPDLRMPPSETGKGLSDSEIDLLRRWIVSGAETEAHWAYQPLARPAIPSDFDERLGPIDRFVRDAQRQRGLSSAPPADDYALLRRVTLDLTGLPPEPAAVEAYLADPRDDKYERWVDGLLDSPSYGERMASYWFDLVRFADTVGYHGDQDHPIAPYRDWVIHAFNEDMPFDQFSTWQLAGDLVDPDNPHALIATGYLRVLQTSHEGGIQRGEYLAKYSADRVRNFGEVWLGSTLGCAECHDHKYDPFTQDDFYSIAAFFADVDDSGTFTGTNTLPTRREPEIEVRSPLDEERLTRLRQEAESLTTALAGPSPTESSNAPDANVDEAQARAAWESRLTVIEAEIDRLEQRRFRTMVARAVEPRDIRVLARGNWMDDTGPIASPHVPRSLGRLESNEDRRLSRADLATWLFTENQALTSRVLVNRLWARFLGRGLADNLGDYGAQGSAPTHPELLEWLAADLIEHDWRLKPWIRQVVLSETYRQSSTPDASRDAADPGLRWLTRQRRPRLEAEVIRDQALATARLLVDEPGGASCRPYQPAGYYVHLNFPPRAYYADQGPGQYRRGVYVHWQRQFLHPMLRAFDAPMREECTAQRSVSNTPSQALTLLNDPTFVEAARVAAGRELVAAGATEEQATEQQVEQALESLWRKLLVRPPHPREKQVLLELYHDFLTNEQLDSPELAELLSVGQVHDEPHPPLREWLAFTMVARAILNLDEAVTRP